MNHDALERMQRHPLKSVTRKSETYLADFAARYRDAVVEYDDSERWLEQLPYSDLEERIQTNMEEKREEFSL